MVHLPDPGPAQDHLRRQGPTILDNIGTQQYFGINSYETAEEISKRIGTATIGTVSDNSSTSSSRPTGGKSEGGNVSTSSGVTHNEIGRRLLLPEEVLTLPDDLTLIFHKNLPVIPARMVRYFEAPEIQERRHRRTAAAGLRRGPAGGLHLFWPASSSPMPPDVAAMPPVGRQPVRRVQRMALRGAGRPSLPGGGPTGPLPATSKPGATRHGGSPRHRYTAKRPPHQDPVIPARSFSETEGPSPWRQKAKSRNSSNKVGAAAAAGL